LVGNDIPAIECGRLEQSIGDELVDDKEDFLCEEYLSQFNDGLISLIVLFGGTINVV
jgi:hypothetical protein